MDPWVLVIIGVCVFYCLLQLWWTRQHNRRLDRHKERMADIYKGRK